MAFEPNDLSELDDLTEEHLGFSALSSGLGFAKQAKGPHPAAAKGQTKPVGKPAPGAGQTFGQSSSQGGARDIPSMLLDEEDQELLNPRPTGSGAVAGGPIWTAPSITQPAAPKPTPTWSAQTPGQPQRPIPPSGQAPVFQPRSYTPPASPTAAVAAGPSTFATAPNYASVVPAARSSAQGSITKPGPSAAQVLSEPAASPGLRLAAFGLDALFIFAPLAAAWMVSFGGDAREIFLADPKSPLLLFGAIFGAYFLLSESFGGQSLGKMLLNLRVVEDDKYQKPTGLRHAATRLVLTLVGAALFGLGLLASFRDAKRRPWQDRYSGSIVRRQA